MSDRIEQLRNERPRNRFLRWSLAGLGVLAVYSWFCGDIVIGDLFSARRMGNLHRFVTVEMIPYPLRDGFEWGIFGEWLGTLMSEQGWTGLLATLAMSVLAIVLAGMAGLILCLPAARSWMTPEPFLSTGRTPGPWYNLGVQAMRLFLLFMRSIPEFIWAYIFLVMFGKTAWPAVLALAIHNAGILGKLNAEVVENLEPGTLRALRALGASRMQIAGNAIYPIALPRFLLYFFYRFETCVREATILGMAGIVSLGYYINDARSRQFYDVMIVLVLLGALIVLFADLISTVARRLVRKAV